MPEFGYDVIIDLGSYVYTREGTQIIRVPFAAKEGAEFFRDNILKISVEPAKGEEGK